MAGSTVNNKRKNNEGGDGNPPQKSARYDLRKDNTAGNGAEGAAGDQTLRGQPAGPKDKSTTTPAQNRAANRAGADVPTPPTTVNTQLMDPVDPPVPTANTVDPPPSITNTVDSPTPTMSSADALDTLNTADASVPTANRTEDGQRVNVNNKDLSVPTPRSDPPESVTQVRTPPPTPGNKQQPTTPVKSGGSSPMWIESPTRQEYSDNLVNRLCTLIDMNDVEGRRYSLHHIPKGLRWGLNWDKDDNLLCLDGKPLMIVLLAEVDQAYWVNNDKSLKKSVALYLRPICDTDVETGKNLLASFATFKGTVANEKKHEGLLIASRKQTKRGSSNERLIYPFRHAYDASAGYRGKADMPRLEATDIGYKDVVLVEVNIGRFRCNEKDGQVVYDKSAWRTWHTLFNMVSVCRLERGFFDDDSDGAYSDHAGDTVF